jgi:hypothetical protein
MISGIVKAIEVARGRRGSVKLGIIELSSSSSKSEESGGEESSD